MDPGGFLEVCGSGDLERMKQLEAEGVNINSRNQVVSSMLDLQ
jgi:hypothetical protein